MLRARPARPADRKRLQEISKNSALRAVVVLRPGMREQECLLRRPWTRFGLAFGPFRPLCRSIRRQRAHSPSATQGDVAAPVVGQVPPPDLHRRPGQSDGAHERAARRFSWTPSPCSTRDPRLGRLALLNVAVLLAAVAPHRRPHDRGVDDLPRPGLVAFGLQVRTEAVKMIVIEYSSKIVTNYSAGVLSNEFAVRLENFIHMKWEMRYTREFL